MYALAFWSLVRLFRRMPGQGLPSALEKNVGREGATLLDGGRFETPDHLANLGQTVLNRGLVSLPGRIVVSSMAVLLEFHEELGEVAHIGGQSAQLGSVTTGLLRPSMLQGPIGPLPRVGL